MAQVVSGTISGIVVDSSNASIRDASVVLTNEGTKATREVKTDASGRFVFTAVLPGTYSIRFTATGFSTVERTGNVLVANSTLDVGQVALQLGQTRETIQVTAQAELVQTGSSENSGVLTVDQLANLQDRSRDVMGLLNLLPGVASGAVYNIPNGPGYGNVAPNIMGHPANWSQATVDGLVSNDAGNAEFFSSPDLDSLDETQVQITNYDAEYSGNGGAVVNLITKAGTNQFHGSGYWYNRNEDYNADNFFNNAQHLARPLYRFNTVGGDIGGPVPIRKLRDRLFFFYSVENWHVKTPNAVGQLTMPTAAERTGNFSQSVDLNGALIPIKDPLNGGAPFPGNIVPASRINPTGQAILNLFPLPNQLNRALSNGNYNYEFQTDLSQPKTNQVFRVDWRPTDKDSFYIRGIHQTSDSIGYTGVPAYGPNFPLAQAYYAFLEQSAVISYTRIMSPSIVNEFSIGVRDAREWGGTETPGDLTKLQRSTTGINPPQLYNLNGRGIIPQMSFGGITNPPSVAFDTRFPIYGADSLTNLTDSVSITKGSHTLKLGYFLSRGRNGDGLNGYAVYMGNFSFARDVNNPLDTNYAYSNALTGNFDSYTESSSGPRMRGQLWMTAGFVQDTWKVNRKLTFNLGLRLNWHNWWTQQDRTGAADFALGAYNRSNAPLLYQPVSTPQGRQGINPVTGQIVPAVYIGAFVPSTGNMTNGMVTEGTSGYPRSFRYNNGLLPEPRIGFAYDPFGNGKTAIRASFGTFHQMEEIGDLIQTLVYDPPIQFNPVTYYGTIPSLTSGTPVLSPQTVYGYDLHPKTPVTYNYTLNIQRDIGFQTLVSAAYVGWVGRHLQWLQNINEVPLGAEFLPQNQDPTSPGRPLNDNFFRPYPGYGTIDFYSYNSTANYNALQVSVRHRLTRGFTFGIAYTYSKVMDFVDNDNSQVATYTPVRIWNYGKAGYDQTHVFVMNYEWDLPKASSVMPNTFVRRVLDDWKLSGITTFASGVPQGINLSTVDGANITGGGDGSRVNVTCNPELGYGDRTLKRFFNTSCFARPAQGSPGNAPKDVFRGPGITNFDATLFKEIPLGKETRVLQLRWEAYNVFNHTQFLSINNNARFDVNGNQVNGQFGQAISARDPRIMQLSLRLKF
jgi:hypothetical protein